MNNKKMMIFRFRDLLDFKDWKSFRLGLIFRVVSGILNGLALLILLPASACLINNEPTWGLDFKQWIIATASIAIVSAIVDFFGTRDNYLGALGFLATINQKVGDKVSELPLGWFTGESSGLLSRMVTQQMMNLAQHMAAFMGQMVNTSAGALVIVIGSWFWDLRLGLLLTLAVPIFYLFLTISNYFLSKGNNMSDPSEQELSVRIIEYARCQGALRATNAGYSYEELDNAFEENRIKSHRALLWESLGQVISGAFMQNIIVAIIFLAGSFAINGTMEPLSALVTIGLGLRFFNILENISASNSGLSERRLQFDHIEGLLNAKSLKVPQKSDPILRPGEVELLDVHFRYSEDKPVLNGISFKVAPNKMCALVGPSGSGKTTIESLISRFYDVNSGSVKVGGVDVKNLTTEDLMNQLSMVFQDVYLFENTLEENIRLGNLNATDDEIGNAADLAGVTEIVKRLPNGWDTRVGEGGSALSGGERQRVSIARALIKKAPIVLLDEATSALDAENEANIVASIEEIRKHSTLIVIAHKLETIMAADQIIMLSDDGKVAQFGTHEELLNKEGPYKNYWNYRSQSVGWRLA